MSAHPTITKQATNGAVLARVGIDGTTAAASPTLNVMDAHGQRAHRDLHDAENADRAAERRASRPKSYRRYK